VRAAPIACPLAAGWQKAARNLTSALGRERRALGLSRYKIGWGVKLKTLNNPTPYTLSLFSSV